MSGIHWSNPPRNDTPRIAPQIVRATPYERFFRFLGEITGVNLHFVGGRSKPCRAHPDGTGDCCYCAAPSVEAARWHGYAPALLWSPATNGGRGEWVVCVLHLTRAAYEQLCQQHGSDRGLRGLVIGLKRGAKERSRVELRVREHPENDPAVDCFDVRPVLLRVWDTIDAPPPQQRGGGQQQQSAPPAPAEQSDDCEEESTNANSAPQQPGFTDPALPHPAWDESKRAGSGRRSQHQRHRRH